MRRLVVLGALAFAAAGCGGGGSSSPTVTIQPARTEVITDFKPTACVPAGKPIPISFEIRQPNGQPLTTFKTGPGPHTGVHLIFVRDDLATIIHHHPKLHGAAVIRDTVVFPLPGPYRLVIDVYPNVPTAPFTQTNYQLFEHVSVCGAYHPQPLPPPASTATVDGYHFTLTGAGHLGAIEAALVKVTVTDPQGRPATFEPWFGALAHAIFFRHGSLDYFHTHVCSRGATGCTSILGASKVTGVSSTPGVLNVGVLVPVAGTWRLFLQVQVDHHILTAPFTLHVS